jgi:hypothetical protein
LGKRFQENFLGGFLNCTSLSKEPTRDTKHPRAVTSNYFRKRSFVAVLRLARQF